MNEKASLKFHPPDSKSQLSRVTRMLRRAQDSLHNAHGRAPKFLELEDWTGVAEGTIKDWFADNGRPTAEFALQLLERIPEKTRHEILDSACRLCPSLEHPRLKCDQTILSLLRTIVSQPRGLTLIQGANDESRTFLIAAMGHSFLSMTERPHSVIGLDVHEPDWFVPVPGVIHLHNLFQLDPLRQAVRSSWPRIRPDEKQLIVFNGIWPVADEFQKQIRALTGRCSVILTNGVPVKPALLKKMSRGPVHIVTVSKHPDNGKGIAVGIEIV